MRALAFWKTVTVDRANFLESFISLLREQKIRFCVVGGEAVNAYVEPLVSLDLDVVAAMDQIGPLESLLKRRLKVQRFPRSINVSLAGSQLRVQIQTDPRYFDFLQRSSDRDVLGLVLPVASVEDVLQGKIWAASDPEPRPSKKQKDFADIARLIEAFPALRDRVPPEILSRF